MDSCGADQRDQVTEVDERKRAEEQFRLVIESVPNGILMVNQAGEITLANAQTESMFGYPREELLGQPIEILLPEQYRGTHPAHRRRFYGDPRARQMGPGRDLVGRRKDGTEFPVEIGLNPLVTSEGTMVLAAIVDITERAKRDEQIRALTERLELATQSAAIGTWDYDVVNNNMVWDKRMYALYGISEDEFEDLFQTWEKSVLPDDLPRVRRELDDAIGRETELHTQFRICTPGGEVRHIQAHALTLRSPSGTAERMIGVNWDITPQKTSEAAMKNLNKALTDQKNELAIAKGRAEESDRLKSVFLATMSHELRTPLNSVIGFTGIVLQELPGPINDEQRKQLGMVQNSARHLLNLINDVLDISKIEAGQLEMAEEPFDMCEVLQRAVGSVTPLAEQSGLALSLDLSPEVGEVFGDSRRVEQVLINLLSNAVKFTEEGKVRAECEASDGQVVTRVVDTGIGIKPDFLEQLFEPFQQEEVGLNRRHEGTGLGLAICRKLAEAMRGGIDVESTPGVGSTFTFTFPERLQEESS